MRHLLMITLSILLYSIFATPCFSQKDIRKADKQLELKAYDLAIKNYESYLEHNPDNAYAQVKLAEAFRQTNDLMKAIFWYEKALSIDSNLDIEYQLNYAHSLKKLGLYEKAKAWYKEYQQENEELGMKYLAGCNVAIDLLKTTDEFDITPFDGNSSQSDFGAALYGDRIVFSSFRKDLSRSSDKQNLSYIQNTGNQLYSAKNAEEVDESDLAFLRPEFREIYGIGPVSYAQNSKSIAYTRNNFSNGAIQPESTETDLSIYLAEVIENGDFTKEYAFPYNEVDHSYAFPHLAFNGSALYFASNRPGGLGGFDIYVSYLKDKEWTAPENLGAEVNTPGNEITPFLVDNSLYFSSDQPNGLGGYDVFKSEVTDGGWSAPQNMGKGINSPADDYYLIVFNGNYIFTSNRLGGRGKDDIYKAAPLNQEQDLAAVNIPLATNLEDLAQSKIEDPSLSVDRSTESELPKEVTVSSTDIVTTSIIKPEGTLDNSADFELYDHFELDLYGAKKAGTSDLVDPSATKYFIQIASLSQSKGRANEFEDIRYLGQIYRFYMTNAIKIRLGSFDSKIDADMTLAKVRRAGYKDAFITSAVLNNSNYELLGNGGNTTNYYEASPDDFKSEYKVRLASYSDPKWFNVNELQYLDGDLEQWTKGYWTIFILGGFDSLEEAEAARIKAVNRGFNQAELVVDDRGVLKRVSKN